MFHGHTLRTHLRTHSKDTHVSFNVQYRAPHTLVYDTLREDGTRSKLLAYATPSAPGE